MNGKVALVTGGSSGIGRAAALAFARAGVRVVLTARGVERGIDVEREIRAAGGTAAFVRADVSRGEEVEALIEKQWPSMEGWTTLSTMRRPWKSPSR